MKPDEKKKATFSLTQEALNMIHERRAAEFTTGSSIVEKAVREYYANTTKGDKRK